MHDEEEEEERKRRGPLIRKEGLNSLKQLSIRDSSQLMIPNIP